MWRTKDISRICRVSLKQIKIYEKVGILVNNIYDSEGRIYMDNEGLKKLFEIRMLKLICFTTREIKIFFDNNLSKIALNQMFKHYVDALTSAIQVFHENYEHACEKNDYTKKELYTLFTHNNRVDNIAYEMYALRKKWYLDKELKNFLRETRRKLFLAMDSFNYGEESYYFKRTSFYFEKFYSFFLSEGLNKSFLHFISFMKWITWSDRYKRQMFKLIGQFNCQPLYELALKWTAVKSNE